MKVEARASVLGAVYSLIALHNLLIDSKSFAFIVFLLLIFPFEHHFGCLEKLWVPNVCILTLLAGKFR